MECMCFTSPASPLWNSPSMHPILSVFGYDRPPAIPSNSMDVPVCRTIIGPKLYMGLPIPSLMCTLRLYELVLILKRWTFSPISRHFRKEGAIYKGPECQMPSHRLFLGLSIVQFTSFLVSEWWRPSGMGARRVHQAWELNIDIFPFRSYYPLY